MVRLHGGKALPQRWAFVPGLDAGCSAQVPRGTLLQAAWKCSPGDARASTCSSLKNKVGDVWQSQSLTFSCETRALESGAPLGAWSAKHAPTLTPILAVLLDAHPGMFGIVGKLSEPCVRRRKNRGLPRFRQGAIRILPHPPPAAAGSDRTGTQQGGSPRLREGRAQTAARTTTTLEVLKVR